MMSDETCEHAFAVDLPAVPCLRCGKQLVPKTQPLPTPGEGDIMLALEKRVRQRREKGIATYGRSLQAFNGRRALVDALEEAVDLAAYLEQELHERAKLEARVAGAAQSHATHVASGNLEAGCPECFHFLKAQLGGQYAQLAGAFQRLWEAKPDEPAKCECGHLFAWHDTAGCSVALCKCQTTRKPQPEAAPDLVVRAGAAVHGMLAPEIANLKAQLAAALAEREAALVVNAELDEQLQAANARADEYKGRESALKRDWIALVDERDAALKAKEEAEQRADFNLACTAKIQEELDAERKRADEAEAALLKKAWGIGEARTADSLIPKALKAISAERDEAQAQAAALREALTKAMPLIRGWALTPNTHNASAVLPIAEAALSTEAGKPLMERLRRLEDTLRAVHGNCGCQETLDCPCANCLRCEEALADAAKEGKP
jgi:hypothetical protein